MIADPIKPIPVYTKNMYDIKILSVEPQSNITLGWNCLIKKTNSHYFIKRNINISQSNWQEG